MNLRFASTAAVTLFAMTALAGCATDADAEDDEQGVSAEEALKTSVTPGTWKMYGEARHEPTPACDVHTVLDLDNKSGAHARLREELTGTCKMMVVPNARSYRLALQSTPCGSKVYAGTRTSKGVKHTITVTDHRTRTTRVRRWAWASAFAALLLGMAGQIAYHPPCTLQHGQKLKGGVEKHLAGLGFRIQASPNEPHLCCGSAGTYSVLNPDIAYQLRDRKLGHLQELQPEVIASANIGCITHLQSGCATPVKHWVELLDEALSA